MNSKPQTQTSDQTQTYDQNQVQNTNQQQTQVQAQNQATTSLQQFLQNFINNTSQNQTQNTTGTQVQNTAQNTTQNTNQAQTQNTAQNTQQAQNQSTTANLSAFQEPVVGQFFGDLMKQYQTGGLTPGVYTGLRVAEPTPAELAARTMATNYASGTGTDFSNSVLGANKFLLDPNQILNPANIPGMQATRDNLTRTVTQNLRENILPGIRNSSSFAGGYGDNRQGIAEGLAIGRTGEALAGALGTLDLGTYQAGLGAMQNALGMAPSSYNVGTSPANTLSQVGAAQRADQQATIEAGRQQFAEQQAASPANTLGILRQLMGVQGEFGGTTTAAGTQTGQATGATTGNVTGTTTGAATGTQTGTTTGQGTSAMTGVQSGTQESTQFAQQLASMLGISMTDLQALMTGQTKGTQTGTGTQTTTQPGNFLQTLGAIGALMQMPSMFGGGTKTSP